MKKTTSKSGPQANQKATETKAKGAGKHPTKRKSIRFNPDHGTLAHIDTRVPTGAFQPMLVALVVEESYRGCGVLMLMSRELQVGSQCRIQVGKSAPLPAEVRWRTELDSQTIRLGLMYIE